MRASHTLQGDARRLQGPARNKFITKELQVQLQVLSYEKELSPKEKNVKGRELRVSCKVPDPISNTAYDCNRLLSEDIQLDEDKSGSIVFERNGDIFLWESVHALLYTSASQPDTGN